jgi:hypothetical protein
MIFDFVELEPDRFQRFHLTTLQVVCKRWNRLLERHSSYWIRTQVQALGLLRKLRKDHGAAMAVRRLHLEHFASDSLEVAPALFNEILFSCSEVTQLAVGLPGLQNTRTPRASMGISYGLQSLKKITDFKFDVGDGDEHNRSEYDW